MSNKNVQIIQYYVLNILFFLIGHESSLEFLLTLSLSNVFITLINDNGIKRKQLSLFLF